ncbi:MAG: hypothetical protein XD84_1859 [Desulfotomaculum sp. 46_80]|nr:MAG: hypothetical protein XD84_1859 [Desulfotomaculum sp. 46_80]
MRYVSYLLVLYTIGRLLGFARYSWTKGDWPAVAGILLLAALTLAAPLLAIILVR